MSLMGSSPSTLNTLVILMPVALFLCGLFMTVSVGNFIEDFDIMWGLDRAKILDDGQVLTLSLDNSSGSGFRSKKNYLFGSINMQLQLVSGNSAGIVTAFYLSSNDSKRDQIDFAFLGNLSGDPYIVYTNIVTEGNGNREQQFYLWFDPTTDFHAYSVSWNHKRIVFAVDGAPIRVFKNMETMGIPYPKQRPMRIYCSLCNTDVNWATRGGLVKTNWSEAPFTVSYRNFDDDKSCIWSNGTSSCNPSASWLEEGFDSASQERLRWVQNNYMIYNYCNDLERFPQGLPPECDIY